MTSIPDDGTWLLKKNERVVDSDTNADLKEFLARGQGATINQHIEIHNGDEQGVRNAIPELKQMMIDVINADINNNGQTLYSIKRNI